MKKVFFLVVVSLLLLTGCKNNNAINELNENSNIDIPLYTDFSNVNITEYNVSEKEYTRERALLWWSEEVNCEIYELTSISRVKYTAETIFPNEDNIKVTDILIDTTENTGINILGLTAHDSREKIISTLESFHYEINIIESETSYLIIGDKDNVNIVYNEQKYPYEINTLKCSVSVPTSYFQPEYQQNLANGITKTFLIINIIGTIIFIGYLIVIKTKDYLRTNKQFYQ